MSLTNHALIRTIGPLVLVLWIGLLPSVSRAQDAQNPQRDAQRDHAETLLAPISLSLQPAIPESVYAPPAAPKPTEGINQGAVHFGLDVGYVTDYLYRGIELSELPEFNRDPLNLSTI